MTDVALSRSERRAIAAAIEHFLAHRNHIGDLDETFTAAGLEGDRFSALASNGGTSRAIDRDELIALSIRLWPDDDHWRVLRLSPKPPFAPLASGCRTPRS